MYGDCAACGAAGAPVKCPCLGAHYCNAQCQKKSFYSHRKECTTVLLKEIEAKRGAVLQLQTSGDRDAVRERAAAEMVLARELSFVSELIRSGLNGKIAPQVKNYPIAEQNHQEAIRLWRKNQEDFRHVSSPKVAYSLVNALLVSPRRGTLEHVRL
jgi:hypothetical protein